MPHNNGNPIFAVWQNPDAAPQARRLTIEAAKAIELASDLGIPQQVVADAFGISRQTVIRIINRARKNPTKMQRDLQTAAGYYHAMVDAGHDPVAAKELCALIGIAELALIQRREDRRWPRRKKTKKGKR